MECYFAARKLPQTTTDGKSSVVMFYIPDVGIRFKAPFAGVDQDHSDLASLLALLEFIDSNQKYLTNQVYQLYGDNLSVINQINGQSDIREEFGQLLQKAEKFRDKYRFSLEWIPSSENFAVDQLLD
jgi:ribonuclease HI